MQCMLFHYGGNWNRIKTLSLNDDEYMVVKGMVVKILIGFQIRFKRLFVGDPILQINPFLPHQSETLHIKLFGSVEVIHLADVRSADDQLDNIVATFYKKFLLITIQP